MAAAETGAFPPTPPHGAVTSRPATPTEGEGLGACPHSLWRRRRRAPAARMRRALGHAPPVGQLAFLLAGALPAHARSRLLVRWPRPLSLLPSGSHDGGGGGSAAPAAAPGPADTDVEGAPLALETPPGAGPRAPKAGQCQRPGPLPGPRSRRGAAAPRRGAHRARHRAEPPLCGSGAPRRGADRAPRRGAGRGGAAGGAGAGGFHPRGAGAELPPVPAPRCGAALVGGHRRGDAGGPAGPAAAAGEGAAGGRPPGPTHAPAPAPLPAPGRGPTGHRPVPGGPGLFGAGGLSETARRQPPARLPRAPGADPPLRFLLLSPTEDGGGAGAGVAEGGSGLVPRLDGPRPLLRPAPFGHRLHLARPGGGGGDGRGQPGGGDGASGPQAPPPFLPPLHHPLPHGCLHLLADVQRLQPGPDGAPEGPRSPSPATGSPPRATGPPAAQKRGRGLGAPTAGVAGGAGDAAGGGAAMAAAAPPRPGGQGSPPPDLPPQPPHPPGGGRPLPPRPPQAPLEGDPGLRHLNKRHPPTVISASSIFSAPIFFWGGGGGGKTGLKGAFSGVPRRLFGAPRPP